MAVDEVTVAFATPPALAILPESSAIPTSIPLNASTKVNPEIVCKNNGTFVVTGPNSFICNCPENTVGVDCGNLLTCETNSCGVNATCTIFNHKKVCTCPSG
uniref:EGF-like domain-containing protein n=1 Tax=Panagrolaimus superbus TaxID=310955 RepID=A0A914Z578_9BILA